VRVGQGSLVVLGDRLVEPTVLVLGDVGLLSQPDGLDLIDGVPLPDLLGDSLGLGLLGSFLLGRLGFTLVLDFGVILLSLLSSGLSGLLLLIGHLLADFLGKEKLDGVLDELRVFLHEVLDLVLLDVLDGIVLQVKGDTGAAAQGVSTGIFCDEELSIGSGGPHVLLIVVGL
jgi:hypothetical protein